MTVILVTGGCGFIGSNFINYYLEKYPNVRIINIDRMDYCASEFNILDKFRRDPKDRAAQGDLSKYQLYKMDINDTNIKTVLETHSVKIVVHFAAQSHVDNSFGNSLQFTRDNVLGTHTLLECCRAYGKLDRFIHISTDETYGEVDSDHEGCTEKSLLNPTNPYAASKAAAEFLVRSYHYSFGLPCVITRGNNVYGPRQYPEKLIPRFITKLLANEKCPIHGEGKTRRNFIFVDDVSSAVETIIQKGVINEIYNIGSSDEFSVLEILDHLLVHMNIEKSRDQVTEFVADRAFNDFRYCINSKKLEALGWEKQVDFKDGLERTIKWYLEAKACLTETEDRSAESKTLEESKTA
jgi:dTDP-glucose 4,6-dehydratase